MKILLVIREPEQLQALTNVFHTYDETLVLETANSAFFALTRLERDTPDLIISAGDVGMSGAEFLEILRADAFLGEIPFILLDETALAASAPGAGEIILEAHASPAVVVGAATSLLARACPEEDAPERTSSHPTTHSSTPVLQGTTAFVSPFDLVTILAKEDNTGHLIFDLNEGAVIRFAGGKLVHAEYEHLVGKAALVETFRTVYAVGNVCFQYHANASPTLSHNPFHSPSHTPSHTLSADPSADPGTPSEPPSADAGLTGPLQVLLLKVALELDQPS